MTRKSYEVHGRMGRARALGRGSQNLQGSEAGPPVKDLQAHTAAQHIVLSPIFGKSQFVDRLDDIRSLSVHMELDWQDAIRCFSRDDEPVRWLADHVIGCPHVGRECRATDAKTPSATPNRRETHQKECHLPLICPWCYFRRARLLFRQIADRPDNLRCAAVKVRGTPEAATRFREEMVTWSHSILGATAVWAFLRPARMWLPQDLFTYEFSLLVEGGQADMDLSDGIYKCLGASFIDDAENNLKLWGGSDAFTMACSMKHWLPYQAFYVLPGFHLFREKFSSDAIQLGIERENFPWYRELAVQHLLIVPTKYALEAMYGTTADSVLATQDTGQLPTWQDLVTYPANLRDELTSHS